MLKKSSFFNLSSRILNPSYQLPDLASLDGLETIEVFKALAAANRALAELKGRAAAIPNQGMLIDTLALQQAKASSEIENIVTTQDELFQAGLFPGGLEGAEPQNATDATGKVAPSSVPGTPATSSVFLTPRFGRIGEN